MQIKYQPIIPTIETIFAPGVGDLAFERSKLTRWPGALIWGETTPHATDKPQSIKEKDITDWSYRLRQRTSPVKANVPPAVELPQESLTALRNRFLRRPERVDEKIEPGFARPNEATFEQLQQRVLLSATDNPVLRELELETFQRNFYDTPKVNDRAACAGALWALSEMNYAVIKLPLLEAIGIENAAILALQSGQLTAPPKLARIRDLVAAKLQAIGQEQHRWSDWGRLPVVDREEKPIASLTLVNIATAVVAIGQLDDLAVANHSFLVGAEKLIRAVGIDGDGLAKGAKISRVIKWNGLAIGVEFEPGDTRFAGTDHARKLKSGYGHIRKHRGEDGEALDCYLAPAIFSGDEPGDQMFAVSQLREDGSFDEEKMMIGYDSMAEARKAYLAEMPARFFGEIKPVRYSKILKAG